MRAALLIGSRLSRSRFATPSLLDLSLREKKLSVKYKVKRRDINYMEGRIILEGKETFRNQVVVHRSEIGWMVSFAHYVCIQHHSHCQLRLFHVQLVDHALHS